MKTTIILQLCFILGMCCLFVPAQAQTFPAEGSKLNYRLIGFVLQDNPQAKSYAVEIANDSVYTAEAFEKKIVNNVTGNSVKIRAEVPAFGMRYTWRAIYTNKKGKTTKSGFYHFSTLGSPKVDTSATRLRIVKDEGQYKCKAVFCDNSEVLYDMKGQPVWFLPAIPGMAKVVGQVRDLKLTRRGTITFLCNDYPYEITYDGKLLWQPPYDASKWTNGKKEHYHHEFTRLDKGNYIVMGTESVLCKLNPNQDSLPAICEFKDTLANIVPGYRRIPFTVIYEYTPDNKIVWSWRSSELFKDYKLQPYFKPTRPGYSPHENAFFFDPKKNAIYVSCKQFNVVVKVDRLERKVVNIYGTKNGSATASLFCGQHSCKIDTDGNLYLFNNNDCNPEEVPTIVVMKMPDAGSEPLEKIWEFKCPVTPQNKDPKKLLVSTGGNVIELADKNMFASLSLPYANIFIAGKDKRILWNAMLEKKAPPEPGNWTPLPQYRASAIETDEQLDKMVFYR